MDVAARERQKAKDREYKHRALWDKIIKGVHSGESTDVLAAIDKAIKNDTTCEALLSPTRYRLLYISGKHDEAKIYGNRLVDDIIKDDAHSLHSLALAIINLKNKNIEDQRDLKLALKAAERASELTHEEDAAILGTLASIHFRNGRADEGLQIREEAKRLLHRQNQRTVERSR